MLQKQKEFERLRYIEHLKRPEADSELLKSYDRAVKRGNYAAHRGY